MILKTHGCRTDTGLWAGNTAHMRGWALIKLRVKLGGWTLIMEKETSLQTVRATKKERFLRESVVGIYDSVQEAKEGLLEAVLLKLRCSG